jgi:hypothetical protein
MADFCAGAGEGNRTLVVSLGSLRGRGFPPFSRPAIPELNTNISGIERELPAPIPRRYRTPTARLTATRNEPGQVPS